MSSAHHPDVIERVDRPPMHATEEHWLAWYLQEAGKVDDAGDRAELLTRMAFVHIGTTKMHKRLCNLFGWSFRDMAEISRDVRIARKLNHMAIQSWRAWESET